MEFYPILKVCYKKISAQRILKDRTFTFGVKKRYYSVIKLQFIYLLIAWRD
ncbi:hypothetical Protein YC6258_04700 [Gynuella sunshinyii YC6258]|uniref:Uncharacterized protein n=1 Tax=Gynuella sunshinyii YC6258 TaxID=1445510 RepID=A0A0C5VQ81_9GAMM|nr:hypothetical Protein YC6258_04700 [Gynuella sunshinyii YC6258]